MRALDLLERVARADPRPSLAQLADDAGLKLSTAANLVRTLALRGYLAREASHGPITLGPAVEQLVDQARHHTFLGRAAQALQRFAARHPAYTALLSRHVDGEVRVDLRLDPRFPDRIDRPHDEKLNPYNKAQSQVFLAFGPEPLLYDTLERFPLGQYAGAEFASLDDLQRVLAQARRLGYVCPPVQTTGYFRIACPVFDARHSLVAAVGTYTYEPPHEAERPQLLADLLAAARDIGHLNADPPEPATAA